MPPSILITQCLQNDFVQPIDRFDPIPNLLHVGFSEAQRLMGERPTEGPLARVMQWADGQPDDALRVVHIRDWHDPSDPAQREHLARFGQHCIAHTPGAAFAFPSAAAAPSSATVIDSLTLNDFHGTGLAAILDAHQTEPVRIGLIGVWTEAKVSFVAYELCTRYPRFELAVCSALTASSSRQRHFQALDQLERILGVRVIDSVGAFVEYLGGAAADAPLVGLRERHPTLETDGLSLTNTDRTLLRYLFRDCRSVQLESLSGGFSGNVVAGARSVDMHGHEQVPHVVKIGPQHLMGKERASFERVQDVLGNSAPHISDFADYSDRGAIKYRYASMGGTFSTTFQKHYMAGLPLDQVGRILDIVFGEQLMRFYKAASREDADLLEHYAFDSRWAPSVRTKLETILGAPATSRRVQLVEGVTITNICDFYEVTLDHLGERPQNNFYHATVHGDLNGANIILDEHDNVWLIDFFHTRRAHVLMDLIKLENDLLYIFTPLDDETALRDAFAITDALMAVRDLAAPLPAKPPVERPALARAWATLRMLRGYCSELIRADRDPFQVWVGQLRYAVHTLSFYESDALQKKWALYTAARCVDAIEARFNGSHRLRVDWIDARWDGDGRVGLTLLPGRRDYGRDLTADIQALQQDGVRRVACLATLDELRARGVEHLMTRYREAGLQARMLPVIDQKATSHEEMAALLDWVHEGIEAGERIMLHCVGGLGRSGMAVACYLKMRGASTEEALADVRRARSPRAIETHEQEAFVASFTR